MRRIAGAAIAAVVLVPSHSAQAGGPIDAEGELAPEVETWSATTPGDNPKNANGAAAAFAFFSGCVQYRYLEHDALDMASFARDIVAGGNTFNDFRDGGKHRDRLLAYARAWKPTVENTENKTYLTAKCTVLNPYWTG